MNKSRWIVILMLLVVVGFFGASAAAASAPVTGAGYLEYIPSIVDTWTAGGNTFMVTTEEMTYYGAMSGTATDVGRVIIHPEGNWSYRAVGTFEGTVDGKYGTVKFANVGTRPDAFSEWTGTWVILGGTGELANLHGHGTFWGIGYTGEPPDVPGRIDYTIDYHFDPD